MRTDDDPEKEIAQLLRHRPGWTLQAAPTPGAPPAWCFASGGTTEISVSTGSGMIKVHVVDSGENLTLGNTDQLVAWLATHKRGALQDPREGVIGGLKRRRFFRWE